MTTAFIIGVRVLSKREFTSSLWKGEKNKLIIQCVVIMEDTQCFSKGLTQQVHHIDLKQQQ